jgi:hypothetical protein
MVQTAKPHVQALFNGELRGPYVSDRPSDKKQRVTTRPQC